MKEAAARIKITRLLEAAGWRFFFNGHGAANVQREPNLTLKKCELDELGENFEKHPKVLSIFSFSTTKVSP